jgi:hypothetical protein
MRAQVRHDVLPDGRPDPCPDVVAVKREAEGVFLCKHFPNSWTDKPCCVLRVTRRPGETDLDALMRGDRMVDQKHAATAAVSPSSLLEAV